MKSASSLTWLPQQFLIICLPCEKAGLIEEEKQKNFIYYSLNLTVFEEILTWIQSLGGKEDEK